MLVAVYMLQCVYAMHNWQALLTDLFMTVIYSDAPLWGCKRAHTGYTFDYWTLFCVCAIHSILTAAKARTMCSYWYGINEWWSVGQPIRPCAFELAQLLLLLSKFSFQWRPFFSVPFFCLFCVVALRLTEFWRTVIHSDRSDCWDLFVALVTVNFDAHASSLWHEHVNSKGIKILTIVTGIWMQWN